MERKLKFNIGDKFVYYDSIYEVTGFYTDYNLHYSVKWIAGNSKDRTVIGIPVINDDKFMPYDESIHYDPCKFKPFDKVLVRFDDDNMYKAVFVDEKGEAWRFSASRKAVLEHIGMVSSRTELYKSNKALIVSHFHHMAMSLYKMTHLPKCALETLT